jgi:hypothetical protein
MARHWFGEFAKHFSFPDNYTTLDLETSGLDPESKLTCTYGYTVVRDRQPVVTKEVVLDWTKNPDVNQLTLQNDLVNVQVALERQGKSFHHSYAYLQHYGVDPIKALEDLLNLIETAESNSEVFVLHNGWAFDVEFIKAAFHNWLHIRWEFHPNLVYDSGIIEKASQLPATCKPLPEPGETMRDFAARIYAIRAPVKWNLDNHCANRYDLLRKAGVMAVDMHKSAADSRVIHCLVEEHRKLAELVDQLDSDVDDNQVAFQDE